MQFVAVSPDNRSDLLIRISQRGDNFSFISIVTQQHEHLKAASMRSIWFELMHSLATFNIPIQLILKLRWLLENRVKKDDGLDYDSQTNRLDAVSLF